MFRSTFAFLLIAALLVACSSAPEPPHYRPYTTEVFQPKFAGSPVPVLYERPSAPFQFIGRYTFSGSGRTGAELMKSAQEKARRVGADAILVYSNDLVAGGGGRHEGSDEENDGVANPEGETSPDGTDTSGETRAARKFDVEMIVYKNPAKPARP